MTGVGRVMHSNNCLLHFSQNMSYCVCLSYPCMLHVSVHVGLGFWNVTLYYRIRFNFHGVKLLQFSQISNPQKLHSTNLHKSLVILPETLQPDKQNVKISNHESLILQKIKCIRYASICAANA